MKKMLTTVALTFALLLGWVAVPSSAHAIEATDCYGQADVDILRLRIASLEYDKTRLIGTLEEERSEHADELRRLDTRAWDVQQEHDAEVNELSAAIGDGERVLSNVRAELTDADADVIRLEAMVRRLRAKIRSLR